MNKVELSGRLTAEPISGSGANPNASPYARFTLAVNRRGGKSSDPDAQTADFISCVGFGKHSETIKNYLHKGSKVIITGRIQTGKYTNREGQTVYTTDVVIEDLEFGESKAEAESRAGEARTGANPGGYAANAAQMPGAGYMGMTGYPAQSAMGSHQMAAGNLPFGAAAENITFA